MSCSASSDAPAFYTVGHSNRSLAEFLALLQASRVQCVVDIRKLAGSRAQPQFNADALAQALPAHGIAYQHLAALGGLRSRTQGVEAARNGLWRNASFHRYADYTTTEAFQAGLRQLLALGARQRCALMCAEAVWWRCHRRIVTDFLLARGCPVWHILGPGHVEAARMTEGAVADAAGVVSYPATPTIAP